VKSFI